MQIELTPLAEDIAVVRLSGRMDVAGSEAVDLHFTRLVATRRAGIIVDLSAVSFLASLGMRTLLTNAKALAHRGGRLVLLSPQPLVASALAQAGIAELIPTFDDLDAARAAVALADD